MEEDNGAAVSVSTPALQTHMCARRHARTNTHEHPFTPSPLHLNSYYNTLTSLRCVSHISITSRTERLDGDFKDYTAGIVCCRRLTTQQIYLTLLPTVFQKQTWSLKIDFLPSRQQTVYVYWINYDNLLVANWNLLQILDPSWPKFHCLYFLAKLHCCHEVWPDILDQNAFKVLQYHDYCSYCIINLRILRGN